MKFHSKKINVLSFFDGISCGQLALKRAGIEVGRYFAAEIDKHAIKITQKNFEDTIQLGSVEDIHYTSGGEDTGIMNNELYYPCYPIDLLLGGSPCQGFSNAGEGLNFSDPRSKLFFEYVRILKEIRVHHPQVIFLLENVKMKKEWQDIISKELGVEPIEINSALVSAQNRKRLYWTNIKGITQPEDKKILLKDVVFSGYTFNEKSQTILSTLYKENEKSMVKRKKFGLMSILHSEKTAEYFNENNNYVFQFPHGCSKGGIRDQEKTSTVTAQFHNNFFKLIYSQKAIDYMNREVSGGRNHWDFKHHSDVENDKSAAVVANFFKGVPYNVLKDLNCIRKFHPIECERLQTLPDNYTEGISDTQRYKAIGNGWTVDVISHILSFAK